jgi:hypothetical protein
VPIGAPDETAFDRHQWGALRRQQVGPGVEATARPRCAPGIRE